MLGMENCAIVYCGMFGGFIGGALTAFAYRRTQRFNMSLMEDYWQSDIGHLKAHLKSLESRLSTISVANPVGSSRNGSYNNGYRNRRPFKQG